MYDWTRLHDLHRHAILTPQKEQSLANWARYQPPQALTVMVGPEGGFTETKEKAAIAAGAIGLAMGPRILRTETAGLTALATLSALRGGVSRQKKPARRTWRVVFRLSANAPCGAPD